jgi:16S rRNA (uracil1498-N3)-methyltransferase
MVQLIAHCEETDKKTLKSVLKPNENITNWSWRWFFWKEIAMAIDSSYIPVSLGNTRLRTETAAIVACHSVAFINEE